MPCGIPRGFLGIPCSSCARSRLACRSSVRLLRALPPARLVVADSLSPACTAAPHLTCRLVPTQFQYNDVYNDLAIQWVAAADVAKVGEVGWEAPEADAEGAGDEVL